MSTPRNGYLHAESFDYFVVRLTRVRSHPARLAGVVERLGSEEKRCFAGGNELLWLMTAWSDDLPAGFELGRGSQRDATRESEEVAS